MAYFWEYMAIYPVESAVIITVLTMIYVGWVKKFWYWHRPSLYCTKMGEWRVRRFNGRIVRFKTKHGGKILTEKWKNYKDTEEIMIDIYIQGQPIRPMKLVNGDIWSVRRNPYKCFKREITMNRKHIIWNTDEYCYEYSDEENPIYILKPHIFEKALMKKIDNLDIKSSRGSKVSPQLIHSGYFNNHLPIPPDEYEEDDKLMQITPYAYSTKDIGGHGSYEDVMMEEVQIEDDSGDEE